MRKNAKEIQQAGITLIALVVTIIVLLILAGVTLNLVLGQNGVINKGQFASNTWANATKDEDAMMRQMENDVDTLATKFQGGSGSSNTLPSGTYEVGQEVTFGNEKFFVLEDNENSVKLLAKYCLNRKGTSQDTSHEPYFSKFSNTCYWFDWDDEESIEYGSLQSNEMISLAEEDGDVGTGIPNAVLMAINYGSSKGATGRLMTVDEVEDFCGSDINDVAWGLFCGHWDEDYAYESSCMRFWLGDYYEDEVIYADGSIDGWWGHTEDWRLEDRSIGVRPVLIVQKS